MEKKIRIFGNSFLVSFFIVIFFYFFWLNRFHLWYFEQIQFFRFSPEYFSNFSSNPGGFIEYIGAFFIQFFHIPILGALIVTSLFIGVLINFNIIFKKLKWGSVIFSLFPVMILVILQSNYHYSPVNSFHFLFVLSVFNIYISFISSKKRLLLLPITSILVFLFSGAYAFIFIILCCFYELLYKRESNWKWMIAGFFSFSTIVLSLIYYYIYKLPFQPEFIFPEVFKIQSTRLFSLLLWFFLPVMLLFIPFLKNSTANSLIRWNFLTITGGILMSVLAIYFITNYAYNKKRELIFKMDYYIQNQEWEKINNLVYQYPGINRLVIYFNNLALSQQKKLTEKLFSYPQVGKNGLRLKWERNKIAPFYGGEVFFYLQYYNEAFRWAFESLVSTGVNPRGIRRLIQTSIANGHYSLASKYLQLMEESLFYKKWAKEKLNKFEAQEGAGYRIRNNKYCCITKDFTSDLTGYNLNIEKLLENCPENEIAFEYYLATLLMDKNVDEIWNQTKNLDSFGYEKIPTHIEEALLIHMNNTGKNINSIKMKIKNETYLRFEQFALSFAKNRNNAPQALKSDFENTFWYYYYFY